MNVVGNPKRGKDSRGNLRKMRDNDKLKRGLKREARARRRGDESFFNSSFPRPGFISRALFGDHRK